MGNSAIRTPSGCNASLTALATAAGTVIELASPNPLAPSVVNGDGIHKCATSMVGASLAIGTR